MKTNIQDISEGSVMWKLVTGINQRRRAVSLPQLRFDENGVSSDPPYGIFAGTNMQSVEVWRRMQTAITTMRTFWLQPPSSGTSYTGQASVGLTTPPIPLATITPAFRAYNGDLELRDQNTTIQIGDIIGQWLIDDMQSALDQMLYYRLPRPLTSGAQASPSSQGANNCQAAYQLMVAAYVSDLRQTDFVNTSVWISGTLRSDPQFGFSASASLFESGRGQVTYTAPTPSDVIVLLWFRGSGQTNTIYYPPFPGAEINTLWESGRWQNSHTLSINDAGITYQDEFPLQHLGISCASLGSRGYRADMGAIAKGRFADQE